MIRSEIILIDNDIKRIRTYSDEGMQIRQDQTGILYNDAVDVPNKYTYTETDIPIPSEPVEIDTDTLENTMRFVMADKLMAIPPQAQPDYLNEHEQEPDYFNEG